MSKTSQSNTDKNNNDINNTEISQKPKIKLSKKQKVLTSVGVIVAVIGILIAVVAANQTYFITRAMSIIMPHQVEMNNYNENWDFTLYREDNDEFNAKKDSAEPLKAFKYYYYDENGEKVTLNYDDLIYEGTEEGTLACAVFYLELAQTLSDLKDNLKIVAVVVAVLIVVGLIVLWYILWSKKYDEERAAAKKKSNANKKKKNKG